jgi:hypothetical protein
MNSPPNPPTSHQIGSRLETDNRPEIDDPVTSTIDNRSETYNRKEHHG